MPHFVWQGVLLILGLFLRMMSTDFARVFEALQSPHMILDRELRYVAANAAYAETTGRRFEELRGQKLFEMFPNPGPAGERLRSSLQRVLDTGESDTLAYLLYPIPKADGGFAERYWTAVHTPIRDDEGSIAYVMQNTVDVTEFAYLRQAATLPYRPLASEASLIERVREVDEANRELLAESDDFRRLFQQAPGFFAVMSGPDHVFTFTSDSYVKLIGGRSVIGLPIRDALPEVVEQGFVDLLDMVYREGKVHQATGARVLLQNEPGEPLREVFLDFSYSPIRARDGSVTGVFVQGTNQTESFIVQRRQRLLLDELNHRVKNALATVQSIAAQTFRSTPDLETARRAFEARLVSLASAHGMLSERQWADAELGAMVRRELSAYGIERSDVQGPYLVVNAKAAIALTLALHELTTNAAKHGAFSSPNGKVQLRWRVESGRDLALTWQENGGPPVTAPERTGFGSKLISRVISGELGGNYQSNYDPAGFSANMVIPADAYKPSENAYDFK